MKISLEKRVVDEFLSGGQIWPKSYLVLCNGPYLDLSISMHLQNCIKIRQLINKIFSENRISASIKRHNSVENERKILFNHPNLHIANPY